MLDSNGVEGQKFKSLVSSILGFSSAQNRLIVKSLKMLNYINQKGDDAVVRIRCSASTWAPIEEEADLRIRASLLAKALESWGSCDVSEISGDAFEGLMSTAMGLSYKSVATPSLAPLSDVLYYSLGL